MTQSIFEYECSTCGQLHQGAPSFSYETPLAYNPDNHEQSGHKLDSDMCMFHDEEGDHFFVRVCLEIPIHDFNEPFLWGVWSTLSESNFQRYLQTFDEPDETDSYFGWFSNQLPYYLDTLNLKINVRPRSEGIRPYIILEETDHPLSLDYHQGISVARAVEIAEVATHG